MMEKTKPVENANTKELLKEKKIRDYQLEYPQLFINCNEKVAQKHMSSEEQLALKNFIYDFFTSNVVNSVAPINILRPIDIQKIQGSL